MLSDLALYEVINQEMSVRAVQVLHPIGSLLWEISSQQCRESSMPCQGKDAIGRVSHVEDLKSLRAGVRAAVKS